MTVNEFIAAEARKPFAWGENDCTQMCDRWVRLRRGVSPVLLGEIIYKNHDEAMAILHRLAPMMNRGMLRAGLSKTVNPQIGDVGLVLFDGRIGPAIHAGAHWITRHEDGFWSAPLENVWKAWSV